MAGRKKFGRRTAVNRLKKIAQAPVNDAVKLAFLDNAEEVEALDLTALAEFRRSEKGVVEIKLVNQAAIWKDLALLADDGPEERAEAFFCALKGEEE